MKTLFFTLFTVSTILVSAQAKLGMGTNYTITPSDTVSFGTSVTFTGYVYNKGNAVFNGTFFVQLGLDTTLNTTMLINTSTTYTNSLIPTDSLLVVVTFTPQANQQGWKSNGNGNTIVVWPVASNCLTADSTKTTIVITTALGLSELNKSVLTIYPNPTKNMLFIKQQLAIAFKHITIVDLYGRKIKEIPFMESIDVSELASGCYFLNITADDKIYRTLFLKE